MKSFSGVKFAETDQYISSMKKIMSGILEKAVPSMDILKTTDHPCIILMVGINGTGKTTTVAKLARYISSHGKTVVIAASDTFRAGAIDQIRVHGENLGIRIISQKMGRSPMIAIRVHPLKPAAVVYIKADRVDELAVRLSNIENVPLITTDLDENQVARIMSSIK